MPGTVVRMETQPIRLSKGLLRNVRKVAPLCGESPSQFIERVVKAALPKELARARNNIQKLSLEPDPPPGEPEE